MQVIPVLDLKGGVVVHARRGQRAEYAPLRSPLVEGCEPVAVARALCAVCRTSRLYVADLDALAGEPVNEPVLATLASEAEPWVDAGAITPERAAALGRAGAARNVIGTESIEPGAALNRSAPPLVLSVDLRGGGLISPDPDLTGQDAAAAAPLARALSVRELLVIDLARVGSGSGPAVEAVAELAAALPGVAIYAGGGVRHDEDLRALDRRGRPVRWSPPRCTRVASRCDERLAGAHHHVGQVLRADRLQGLPPGIPLTSSTKISSSEPASRSTPATSASTAAAAASASHARRRSASPLGARAARDVRPPRIAHPLHRAGDLASDDQYAHVTPA